MGQMQQVADVNGATEAFNPDGSMTLFRGGLYALRSNTGRRQRDELAFIPEVGLNVGIQLTRHLKLFARLHVSVDQHGGPRRGTDRFGNQRVASSRYGRETDRSSGELGRRLNSTGPTSGPRG